ncbi:MAG: PEP/pyruvate-binding domain-containing protein [Methanophagales archaeon]|nr:PEP/pyruvate-binding domain-containing protein [Methanophagales archaeon]
MTMIKSLTELTDPKISEVGGKGYSLAVLINNDFNVSQGFVITSDAFFKFLKDNALIERIEKIASEIDENNFEKKSKEIRDLILDGNMPEDIASEIEEHLNKLTAQYVSIRSSAVSEDSLKASFAGLHDTFLNIKSELELVLENVKKCWASLFNDRAVVYRIRKGIPHLDSMAVIIQEMIKSDVSGIIFTVHPVIDKGLILIEAFRGLGDRVAGGEITPDSYTLDRETLKIKDKQLIGSEPLLHEKDIMMLAEMALKVEKVLGYPQDIEFAISNRKIFILQSRPITR